MSFKSFYLGMIHTLLIVFAITVYVQNREAISGITADDPQMFARVSEPHAPLPPLK